MAINSTFGWKRIVSEFFCDEAELEQALRSYKWVRLGLGLLCFLKWYTMLLAVLAILLNYAKICKSCSWLLNICSRKDNISVYAATQKQLQKITIFTCFLKFDIVICY